MRLTLTLSLALLAGGCGAQTLPTAENDVDGVADSSADAGNQVNELTATNTEETPPFAEVPNAHPTAPEPAPIPARFRGTWAENKPACADLKHPSRLSISGRTVRTPTAVLFGDRFTFPAPNQFALEGKYEGSGRVGAAHYSINAADDVLTDEAGGGAVRVRCA